MGWKKVERKEWRNEVGKEGRKVGMGGMERADYGEGWKKEKRKTEEWRVRRD